MKKKHGDLCEECLCHVCVCVTSTQRFYCFVQSTRDSEREFHETLVHPAMFAHPSPKHVAVIGGGEGATVREILKHNTVESVIMIEVDEMLVDIAREHLPYMNDCSDIMGVADNCLDDSRTTLIVEDATQWFKDHYGKHATKAKPVSSFDVIILDAFDPKEGSEMYRDIEFLDALYASLSPDGVFSLHVGSHHTIHDPKADMGVYAPREKFFNLVESHPSTAAMTVYEEAHCGFEEPHAFLTVCKDATCKSRWYAEPVAVDDEIYDRIKRTKSNKPALIHFDGATQHSYQFTPRAWETVYCRREPQPFECSYRGLDLSKELFEMGDDEEEEGSFEVKTEIVNGKEMKYVYAKVDIPKGSYIMPSDVAASVVLSDDVIKGLKDNTAVKETGEVTVIKNFLDFIDRHGHSSLSTGTRLNYVEVGGSTFIRKSQDTEEVNVGRWIPEHPSGKIPVWSPVYDRHMMAFDVFIVATKDIKAGEEVVRPIKY
jgi:Spermidine synthase